MINISLCMIVKNEEANLKECLDSISQLVDEIIIVDTGSTDRTKEIAQRYTDKVYDYPWHNDFSAARNFSIEKASNEYILVLDADETVESFDIIETKRLIERSPNKVGRLFLTNEFSRMGAVHKSSVNISRLFSKNHYKYVGRIHEQITPIISMDVKTFDILLRVNHLGYEGDLDTRKKKTERNINLLKEALLETPDDPYIIYQLGKSHYMEEDYISACNYFGQALYYDLDIELEYVQDMVESYGYALINSEQYEQALQLINVYDEFSHSADFIFMIAMALMNNGRFQEAIEEFIKATKKKVCKMEGVNGYLAYYNIGVIFECLGDLKSAKKYYIMSEGYDLATERIKEIKHIRGNRE